MAMRVWKSPVLYLGLFLVAAVIMALAAPYVIDWNTYRADIEAYGRNPKEAVNALKKLLAGGSLEITT